MKKFIRILLIISLLVIGLLSLCSCNMLDELKQQRVDSISGDNLQLEYQGKKYTALTFKNDRYINIDVTERCYIVEPDVPLLLIDSFGKVAEYDGERDLIRCNYVYYATEENYDKYNKILQEGKLDSYRFSYWTYDDDYNRVEKQYVLDEKTVDLIEGTKDNVIGQELKNYDYSNWEEIQLDSCDSNNIIYKLDTVTLYHNISNNKYGIILIDDGDLQIIKEFPESGFAMIRELFAIYKGTNNENVIY